MQSGYLPNLDEHHSVSTPDFKPLSSSHYSGKYNSLIESSLQNDAILPTPFISSHDNVIKPVHEPEPPIGPSASGFSHIASAISSLSSSVAHSSLESNKGINVPGTLSSSSGLDFSGTTGKFSGTDSTGVPNIYNDFGQNNGAASHAHLNAPTGVGIPTTTGSDFHGSELGYFGGDSSISTDLIAPNSVLSHSTSLDNYNSGLSTFSSPPSNSKPSHYPSELFKPTQDNSLIKSQLKFEQHISYPSTGLETFLKPPQTSQTYFSKSISPTQTGFKPVSEKYTNIDLSKQPLSTNTGVATSVPLTSYGTPILNPSNSVYASNYKHQVLNDNQYLHQVSNFQSSSNLVSPSYAGPLTFDLVKSVNYELPLSKRQTEKTESNTKQ